MCFNGEVNPLREQSPADLKELKGKTGLSNKKWDTSIKGLRANNLAKVEKTEEGLFVELVRVRSFFCLNI